GAASQGLQVRERAEEHQRPEQAVADEQRADNRSRGKLQGKLQGKSRGKSQGKSEGSPGNHREGPVVFPASAIASCSTSRSPMWLARISTSRVSRAAASASDKFRRASTSATYAASGSANREAVTSFAIGPLVLRDRQRPSARACAAATLSASKRRQRAHRCWSGRTR